MQGYMTADRVHALHAVDLGSILSTFIVPKELPGV